MGAEEGQKSAPDDKGLMDISEHGVGERLAGELAAHRRLVHEASDRNRHAGLTASLEHENFGIRETSSGSHTRSTRVIHIAREQRLARRPYEPVVSNLSGLTGPSAGFGPD